MTKSYVVLDTIIALHSLTFYYRLFDAKYIEIWIKSSFSLPIISLCDVLEVHAIVSSAKSFTFTLTKSLMYNKNNVGPRTVPCGTPCLRLHHHTSVSYTNLKDRKQKTSATLL